MEQLTDEETDLAEQERAETEDREAREAEARRKQEIRAAQLAERVEQEDREAREAEARRKREAQADRLADDMLDGAAEIAEFLGTNTREVYWLAKTKRLPIGRLGKKLIAFRSQLRRSARALTA